MNLNDILLANEREYSFELIHPVSGEATGVNWVSIVASLFGGGPSVQSQVFAKGAAFTSNGLERFANGGAFDSKRLQRFADGAVFNSPTTFRFANGAGFSTGLMAEAGPEAVMPLKRGKDGKLGVAGSGATVTINQRFNVTGGASYADVRRAAEEGKNQALAEIYDSMRRNGAFSR